LVDAPPLIKLLEKMAYTTYPPNPMKKNEDPVTIMRAKRMGYWKSLEKNNENQYKNNIFII
jgi:hypothetical protein